MVNNVDVIIIGAGAAGLMCGIQAGKRGRRVLILDKSNKVGKKILMSGGGRCNFTNIYTSPEQFISQNEHFCKSALSRFTPSDFITMVNHHCIQFYEKTLGQLFCKEKSQLIVDMLLKECKQHQVEIQLHQHIDSIQKNNPLSNEESFVIYSNKIRYECHSLVVATGGLSIPTLGSSPFGYQIATQFGLKVHPTRAGLVPFTLHTQDKQRFEQLSGISVHAHVSCNGQSFQEDMLFTHRGLSGPAMLQISSYWRPGDEITVRLIPDIDLYDELKTAKMNHGESLLKTALTHYVPKRLLAVFYESLLLSQPLKSLSDPTLRSIAAVLQQWSIKPNATEGYRTAEVTLGGVDCNEISSKNFESKHVKGLYFIGEVLDVSGWLGGYNFQWAWSSGWAAGQVV